MRAWKTLKNAEGKKGVRYREHPTRKHGIMPDRYYVLAYWYNGKSISEAVGWASEKWTPTKCFNLLAQLKHNQKAGSGPCTLADLRAQTKAEKRVLKEEESKNVSFKKFMDDIFLPDANLRLCPETVRKIEEHTRNWIDPVTGDTPMRELGMAHLNRIKNNMAGKSPRTVQYVFRNFTTVWNTAADYGFVSGPCLTKSASFRLPKVDNERGRYLTLDEETILLEKINERSPQVHDIAIIAIDSGLRFREIAKLSWGCVDIENSVLRILDSKGKDRLVPMTERLEKLFASWAPGKPEDLIFPNRKGKVQSQVPSSFKRAVVDAKMNEGVTNKKLKASFHTLRHTYASRLVQAGVDIYRVQRLLGHSTPTMTARYSKLADTDLKQAVKKMERDCRRRRGSAGKVIELHKKVK